MKLGECTNNNWYINKCMKIEPIKKVDKIENNKGIGYYHNRGYSRKIHEGFEDTKKEKRKGNDFKQKYNEAKDSKLSENEQSEAKNENKNESQSIQAIYNMEAMRIKNSQIYEKDLTEHEKNYELQMQRAKRAYNKSDKVKDKPKEPGKDDKPKETEIKTKRQEMEEFKESLKQKPKSDLDIAFEKFEEELAKKKEFDKSIHKKDGKKYGREI